MPGGESGGRYAEYDYYQEALEILNLQSEKLTAAFVAISREVTDAYFLLEMKIPKYMEEGQTAELVVDLVVLSKLHGEELGNVALNIRLSETDAGDALIQAVKKKGLTL